MFKEFKKFILTGNVIDLAVAVILAGAVGLVVKGFVGDIMMPVVGHFTGGADFSNWVIELSASVMDADGNVTTPANVIRIGNWINSLINLVTVGFVLFMMVKAYNKTKKPVEVAPAAPKGPSDNDLLSEIRDLLKK